MKRKKLSVYATAALTLATTYQLQTADQTTSSNPPVNTLPLLIYGSRNPTRSYYDGTMIYLSSSVGTIMTSPLKTPQTPELSRKPRNDKASPHVSPYTSKPSSPTFNDEALESLKQGKNNASTDPQ